MDTIQSKKKSWHFAVEKDFIIGTQLSPMARLLYIVLMSYASPSSPLPFPGMKLLAAVLDCTQDTVRKYRYELEEHGWLEVERRKTGDHKFERNAYTLLDGPGAIPKKPDTAFSRNGTEPTRINTGAKSTQAEEEGNQRTPSGQARCEAPKTSSSNTSPSASAAAAAASFTPSATGADAPDPRYDIGGVEGMSLTSPNLTPDLKAERFVIEFKRWAKEAGLSSSITPRDKQAVIEYFQENEEITVRHLIAIMLGAWLMDPLDAGDDAGRQKFWFSNKKARRVFTLMKHLTEIQDELNWKGTEEQIQKVLAAANNRFCIKGRKVVQ